MVKKLIILIEKIKKFMAQIIVNDIVYTGNDVIIRNNKIIINGVDITPDTKEINISVIGNVDKVDVSSCNKIEITGDTGNITTQNGDIKISGNVSGNVKTQSSNKRLSNIYSL